jgi:thiol:disulfide interchange protein
MNLPIPRTLLHVAFVSLIVTYCYSCKYQVAVSPPWKNEKSVQKPEFQFVRTDLVNEIERAKEAGKPVFLDFYTSWCGPCRVMDRDVFTNGDLAAFFNKWYLNLKIDAEKGEGVALAKRFGISGYPTLLFLGTNGKETKRVVGITTASKLMKMGKEVRHSK